MKNKILFALIFLFSLSISYAQVRGEWVARYNGPANDADRYKESGLGSIISGNSITFNGRELILGISSAEFLKEFSEFKKYDPSEMEFIGRDSDEGYQVYSFIYKNDIKIKEFDPFENMYAIFIKFKNDSLKEFEMLSGHSEEVMQL